MQSLFSILLVLLTTAAAVAQPLKMATLSAEQQNWSGGIAGRSGSNYNFTLSFTGKPESFTPDTLWIGDHPIPLQNDGGRMGGYTITRKGKKITLHINAGISRNKYEAHYPQPEKKPTHDATPPVKYKGVALLSYTYKGIKGYYTLKSITRFHDPVNYP